MWGTHSCIQYVIAQSSELILTPQKFGGLPSKIFWQKNIGGLAALYSKSFRIKLLADKIISKLMVL